MRFNTLIVTLLIIASSAHGLVDMNNASYSDTWVDFEVPGSGFQLRVLRAYKSRTLYNGMFGFGWCSEYETHLNETPEGGVKVSECGDGEEIFYSAKEISKADKERVIARIFENMKSAGDNPGFSADYMAQLKKRLMRDQTARESYAAQYKVTIPVKTGAMLMANAREVEHVIKEKKFYTRHLADGSSQRFDLKGRLTGLYNKNGDKLTIGYEGDRMAFVENSKARLTYQYFENGKVQKITGPGGVKAEYRYSESEDLTTAKSDSQVHAYEYNEFHNMTKAVYPDKTFILIKYDNQKDWVTGFTDREKCTETYKYESSAANPELNYWATTIKICDGETVANNRYEFWHKQLPAGQTVLSRIQTNLNGVIKDVVYDDILGKPLSIKTASETATYTYLPNGLLKTKTTKDKTLEFSYDNKLQKVSKVVEKTSDKKSRFSNYKYDSKGNLIFAENSEGKKIRLEYDSMGRIVRILDGSKTPVTLKYEEKFGKPSEISRKDLGSVVITYKANGEISSVESSKGPLAAEQIAGSYNTLLGILAPASQNIY